jgi:Ca-activated chloride channel family protein
MSELERLRKALHEERSEARREAKEAAITAALAAFDAKDAKYAKAHQGSRSPNRLRVAARAVFDILTGKRSMTRTHALAGGVSLAALMLGIMVTANVQNLGGIRLRETERESTALKDTEQTATSKRGAQQEIAAAQAPVRRDAELEAAGPSASVDNELDESALADMPVEDFGAASRLGAAPPAAMAEGALAPAPTVGLAPSRVAGETLPPPLYADQGRDNFETIEPNPLKLTAEEPVSTFSVDVDTASYSFMRAALQNGVLPQADAVRVEELVNYFPYDYPAPENREEPFRANVTVMETPWNAGTKLVHLGIKGFEIAAAERPKANLVFLVDSSGSMQEPNKLPLLINSLKLLVDGLSPDDSVAIVAYAGSAGTVLEPTPASEKAKIIAALESLYAGGSTAGAEGIRQAYQLAERNFDAGGVNRVILATDGDFNVGITDTEELKSFVERERESGIFLSVLGFGMGNYNDALMQALAQNGNGAAAYIDTLNEARKVLVEEAGSTMFPIAKDVKIQVEFNPRAISEYRLIGYETRLLEREDFNNDRVDAGEIGSGHTVTALYEVTPNGSPAELVDGLRYQGPDADGPPPGTAAEVGAGEYGFLKIRYKLPGEDASRLIETPIREGDQAGGAAPREARFAASVAAFGQILRGGRYTGDFDHDDVIALAQANKGEDEFGYRAEFINLVRLAKTAAGMEPQRP